MLVRRLQVGALCIPYTLDASLCNGKVLKERFERGIVEWGGAAVVADVHVGVVGKENDGNFLGSRAVQWGGAVAVLRVDCGAVAEEGVYNKWMAGSGGFVEGGAVVEVARVDGDAGGDEGVDDGEVTETGRHV